MARTIQVPVTPSVLRWAIKESGYSQAELASALEIPGESLASWAAGTERPPLTLMTKLARRLRRPLAAFLLPSPPERDPVTVEFRHPPGDERTSLNPKEAEHLREAARLQRVASWALREMGERPADLPAFDRSWNAERVAMEARDSLLVSVKDQLDGWKSSSEAFKGWRLALERMGVLVFSFPLGVESCRGFSEWDAFAPLVAVNTAWNIEARTYSLFHEFGHLLRRTSSACFETAETIRSKNGDPEERWCEEFAAAFLMPSEAIKRILADSKWKNADELELETVKLLARRFKVSLRAACLRLISLKLADWSLYKALPPLADAKNAGGGGGGRDRVQIRLDEYGNRTSRVFLQAFHSDVLTRADVLDYLNVHDSDLALLKERLPEERL